MRPELLAGAGICAMLALIALTQELRQTAAPEGFERAGVAVEGFRITLTSECSRLSIAAAPWQLDAIAGALEGSAPYRPETHGLMADAIEGLGAEVVMVRVEAEEGGTYYARLIIADGRKILDLDARPSDAIAVAVRAGAPVYVSRDVLKNAVDICAGKAA